jgi:hypothetical protein
MSESVSAPETSIFVASPEATVKVHNALLFGEDMLWTLHIAFAVLSLVGVVLIVMGRGPRRADANLVAANEVIPQAVTAAEQAKSGQVNA